MAVVGVGFSEISATPTRSLGALAVDAAEAAAADAGITISQIDGLSAYPSASRIVGDDVEGIDVVGVNYLARVLDLRGVRWYTSLAQGSVAAAVVEAAHAVAVGACDHALVWRAMHGAPGVVLDGADPGCRRRAVHRALWLRPCHDAVRHSLLAVQGEVRRDVRRHGGVHRPQPRQRIAQP